MLRVERTKRKNQGGAPEGKKLIRDVEFREAWLWKGPLMLERYRERTSTLYRVILCVASFIVVSNGIYNQTSPVTVAQTRVLILDHGSLLRMWSTVF